MSKWIIIMASICAAVLALVVWVTVTAMRYAQGLTPAGLSIFAVIAVAFILPIFTGPLLEVAAGLLGLAVEKDVKRQSDLFN